MKGPKRRICGDYPRLSRIKCRWIETWPAPRSDLHVWMFADPAAYLTRRFSMVGILKKALICVVAAGALSLFGCETMETTRGSASESMTSSTTMPSSLNQQTANGSDNSSIGNGAFGEPPP